MTPQQQLDFKYFSDSLPCRTESECILRKEIIENVLINYFQSIQEQKDE